MSVPGSTRNLVEVGTRMVSSKTLDGALKRGRGGHDAEAAVVRKHYLSCADSE